MAKAGMHALDAANPAECARLACQIIDDFHKIPTHYPKYTFPFVHYVTSATVIVYDIVIKYPTSKDAYRESLLTALQMLKVCYRRTWISGKMIRIISKMNTIISETLGGTNGGNSSVGLEEYLLSGHTISRRPAMGKVCGGGLESGVTLTSQDPSLTLAADRLSSTTSTEGMSRHPRTPGSKTIPVHREATNFVDPNWNERPMPWSQQSQSQFISVQPEPKQTPAALQPPMEQEALYPPSMPMNVDSDLPMWALTDFGFEEATDSDFFLYNPMLTDLAPGSAWVE